MGNAIFELKSVFGRVRIYPVNDIAKAFCRIAGVKTMPYNTLLNLDDTGVTYEVIENGLNEEDAE